MEPDRVDRAIIAELRRDARLSIRALAERVHLSRTSTHARVQRLIETGVITGFAALVDPEALGLRVMALVVVTVTNEPWTDIERRLAEIPYVERVLAVSGDIDFVLTVRAPDHATLSEIIMRLVHDVRGVASTRSHVVLDDVPGSWIDDRSAPTDG